LHFELLYDKIFLQKIKASIMKTKYVLQPVLIILISIIFIACNDNPNVIEPESPLISGSFQQIQISANSISLNEVISNSSVNDVNGTNSSSDTTTGNWNLNQTLGNTDLSSSTIVNDTLRFRNFHMELMNFGAYQETIACIKFNHKTKKIDSLFYSSRASTNDYPQDADRVSNSFRDQSVILKNIPYTIASNGNIIIDLKGVEIQNYSPYFGHYYRSHQSDMHSSSDHYETTLGTREISAASTVQIEITKAK
jgi:hypothetical protein